MGRWAWVAMAVVLSGWPVEAARSERGAKRHWTEAKARRIGAERSHLSMVARKAMAAVVSITTTQPAAEEDEGEDQRGLGSGFLFREDGMILTSAHVIDGAKEIRVSLLTDEGYFEELPAEVVGKDEQSDVAVIKVSPTRKLPVLSLGTSSGVEIADWVVVIGNPFGLGHSVSVGVVSFKGRTDVVPSGLKGSFEYIQTDAAINPGNSGGPVLDLNGDVVAMANAVNVSGQGIAFAIPIEVAKTVVPQLLERGLVRRGFMGIAIDDLSPELARALGARTGGVLVSDVLEEGPAARAGLQVGDVIIGVDGLPVSRAHAFRWRASNRGPGLPVALEVRREGHPVKMELLLEELPEPVVEVAPAPPDEALEIGAVVREVDPATAEAAGLAENFGAVVERVAPGSPCQDAGLTQGDVVLKVNRTEIDSAKALRQALGAIPSGEVIRLFVRRGAETRSLVLRKP
jgi:serine protease Do